MLLEILMLNTDQFLSFVFFNFVKYRRLSLLTQSVNPGLDAIKRTFPGAKITGLLTHAQYEHNFWPELDVNLDVDKPSTPSTASLGSLLLIHIEKL